jgi:translation initiation factor 2-alpha kinase 4
MAKASLSAATKKASSKEKQRLSKPVTNEQPNATTVSNEELAELQATEVQVLQSILGDDFTAKETDVVSAWGPASPATAHTSTFQIVLRPDTDSLKTLVYATCTFRLPIRYPLLPPIISVLTGNKSHRGLSDDHLKSLQAVLTNKAKELAGSPTEILWEVISVAQEHISKHNLEYFAGPNRSLEEEKQLREVQRRSAERKAQQQERQKRTKEEEERAIKIAQLIREQSERNTAAMQQVMERKRDASALSPSDTQLASYLNEEGYGRSKVVSSTDNFVTSPAASTSLRTEFFMNPIDEEGNIVHRLRVGPLLGRTSLYSSYIVESAQGSSSTSTNLSWQMDEFRIQAPYYDLSSGKRAIEEVEWELDKLRQIRCDSLVNVRADSLIAEAASEGRASVRRLLVVFDMIRGTSTEALLSHGIQLPWSRVRFYLRDLTNALDALHSRNLVHRNVHVANIFLDGQPGKLATAKLARAGYAQRLRDMHAVHPLIETNPPEQAICPADDEELPAKWEAPEQDYPSENVRHDSGTKAVYTRKRDIWQVGVVALQMLFGSDVVKRYSSANELLSNADDLLGTQSAHVVALLRAMLDPSARKRPTASELRARLEEAIRYEDEEMAGSASHLSSTFDSESAQKLDVPKQRPFVRTTSERENPFRPGSFWQLSRTRTGGNDSRYENDFEELELLGKGAYGAVYRARNRLDGRDYAIKKIRLSASAENDDKTLREITALSRLSHQNIVRYVTSWIQAQDDDLVAPSTTDGGTLLSSITTGSQQGPHAAVAGINDDYMSYGHDAFSHSASHIRFGNESDSDDDSDDVEGRREVEAKEDVQDAQSSADSSSSSSSSSEDESDVHDVQASRMHQSFSVSNAVSTSIRPRWLFIQMEFVENQTLREAIDNGLSIDESWRLFRQMLEALAHVASLGIIHRDLKPSNILMVRSNDASGIAEANGGAPSAPSSSSGTWELKIGDFGLATTTTANQGGLPVDGLQSGFGTQDENVDQTTDIGTNLYIAPEVLKAGTLRYDHKVDVYAAGVVFFEMLASQRVYKTGMERIQILRDLRLPDVRFPAAWDESQYPAQTKILRKMLSHNPAERPSPLELLKSDLLPPKMEDEYIAECMRLLSMPNSTYNLQLMESLFESKETFEEREARDFTFDAGSNEGQGLDNRFIGVASHHLRTLFHRRGAVELEAPLLLPPNELYGGDQQRPVELLDRTGKIVQLPHDLLVPFARMVAHGEQDRFKRYAIAPVYRPNLLAGGQPRSVLEVDFDIVAPEKTPAAEAEVLGVVDEILEELPGFNASEWVIQISHGTVLDLLLDRVPKHRRAHVFAAIGKLNSAAKSTATQGRVLLSTLNLPRSITDELDGANLSDDVEVVFDKLQRIIAIDLRPKLTRAVQEIRQVIEAAQQFGVQRRFLFTPLLVTNASFYRENVFFVVSRGRGKRKDVLASGGRYDALLKRFASPTLAKPPSHAVGIQIALGRIAVALAKHHEVVTGARLTNKSC